MSAKVLDCIAVLFRKRDDDRAHLFEQRNDLDIFEKNIHTARLDLRQIEDIVDQTEEVATRPLDLPQVGNEVVLSEMGHVLLKDFAVADDSVKRRAQLVAHIGEKLRLGAIRRFRSIARDRNLMHEIVQLRFPVLEFGDVRVRRHHAALRGAPLADANPPPVRSVLEVRSAWIAMRCHSLGDPALGVALRVCDQAVVGGVCHDRLERRSDHRCFTAIGKHFLVTRVANGDPVVCIVKRESFGYRLDCFGERLLHGAPIDDVFPKHLDGLDHSADLVAAVAMADLDVDLAGGKALHRIGDGFYGPYYGLTNYNGDKTADQKTDDRHQNNEIFVHFGIGIEPIAQTARGLRYCIRQILKGVVDGLEGFIGLTEHHRRHCRVALTDVDGVLGVFLANLPLAQKLLHALAFGSRQVRAPGKSGNAVGQLIEVCVDFRVQGIKQSVAHAVARPGNVAKYFHVRSDNSLVRLAECLLLRSELVSKDSQSLGRSRRGQIGIRSQSQQANQQQHRCDRCLYLDRQIVEDTDNEPQTSGDLRRLFVLGRCGDAAYARH